MMCENPRFKQRDRGTGYLDGALGFLGHSEGPSCFTFPMLERVHGVRSSHMHSPSAVHWWLRAVEQGGHGRWEVFKMGNLRVTAK
jgi:hypothetical protein